MSKFDDSGRPNVFRLWWDLECYDGRTVDHARQLRERQRVQYQSTEAIAEMAFEAGRQSVIADLGEMSERLGEMAAMIRAGQTKIAEEENKDETVTQTQ